MTSNPINDGVTMQGGGTGTVLAGRYRILRQLGAGGMGSVWLAEDMQLDGKLFAIKMLPALLVANKRAYRQLKDEALVAMRLVHPNIVQIRAFEENDGNPFLVMDYIDGQTLDDLISEKGKLNEAETVKFLRPIAAALDYAHGEGVVHRDVKPANVMIRKDGHPFILDFGIAREIQETLTRVTGKLSSGTLLYMSPEQLNGAQPKAPQDVYSFAAMAYECLKGEPPFVRGQIEWQIINAEPEPLPEDVKIAAAVMVSLAKKPEERSRSCMDVVTGPQGFRQGGPQEPRNQVGWHDRASSGSKIVVKGPEFPGELASSQRRGRKSGVTWKVMLVLAVAGLFVAGGWWWKSTKTVLSPLVSEIGKASQSDAEGIREVAKEQYGIIDGIDGENGFKQEKKELADDFERAEALWNDAKWNKAALAFTNYVNRCSRLADLDVDRRLAMAKRRVAKIAKKQAEEANSEKCVGKLWKDACRQFDAAEHDLDKMRFKSAADKYDMAIGSLRQCESGANQLSNDVISVSIKAKEQKKAIGEMSGEDGFDKRRKDLDKLLGDAVALSRKRRWPESILLFSNYVVRCRDLVALDGARRFAVEKRTEAEVAKKEAEELEAKRFAGAAWSDAMSHWTSAIKDFGGMSFSKAADGFITAGNKFARCSEAARQNAVPTLNLVAKIGRHAIAGAKVHFEDGDCDTPVRMDSLKSGSRIGPYEVTYESGDKRYYGTMDAIVVDWRGGKEISVALKEGPKLGDTVTLILNEHDRVKMEMIYCAPGSFMMGSPESEAGRHSDEKPHRVTFTKGFWLGKYEVTRKQWRSVMGNCPSESENDGNPVADVSWNDCQEFIGKVNAILGCAGRLPTEAEWEYACRAGTKGAYGGSGILDGMGWYAVNSDQRAHLVGRKKANDWGFHDMHGNVSEWCNDWNGDYGDDVTDPVGSAFGSGRVRRGGSWHDDSQYCRSAARDYCYPFGRSDFIGFRFCCSDIPEVLRNGDAERRRRESGNAKSDAEARRRAGLRSGMVKTMTLPGGAKVEMIYCAPGSFTMGSPASEKRRNKDTEAQHRVTLTRGFWLGKYEVTQEQWQSVMRDTPSQFTGDPQCPVENVTWFDCKRFVDKIEKELKCGVRLPTEAEWEYACRAGRDGAYGGAGSIDSIGWYWENGDSRTHPVGQKRGNAWGFHDMNGNVWEWCEDWYRGLNLDEIDPQGPSSGLSRVYRGGSWDDFAHYCRSSYRGAKTPDFRDANVGMRLCCSEEPQ